MHGVDNIKDKYTVHVVTMLYMIFTVQCSAFWLSMTSAAPDFIAFCSPGIARGANSLLNLNTSAHILLSSYLLPTSVSSL
jgi:hypothetical protein